MKHLKLLQNQIHENQKYVESANELEYKHGNINVMLLQ